MPGCQTHTSLYDKSSILEPCAYAVSASVPKERAVTWEPRPIRCSRWKRSAAGAVLATCACCIPQQASRALIKFNERLLNIVVLLRGSLPKSFDTQLSVANSSTGCYIIIRSIIAIDIVIMVGISRCCSVFIFASV